MKKPKDVGIKPIAKCKTAKRSPKPLTLRDTVKALRKAGCKVDFELRPLDYNKVVMQRDQVLHLLHGGHLTPGQVADSGLGQGVLLELNHIAHKLKCSEHLLDIALASLDDIATMPKQRRAKGVAIACLEFIYSFRQKTGK